MVGPLTGQEKTNSDPNSDPDYDVDRHGIVMAVKIKRYGHRFERDS